MLVAALLGFSGCASTPEPMDVDALLGCWYFDQSEAGEQPRLPWGVELTSDSLEGWPAVQSQEGVRRATTLTASGPRDFPIGYWRLSAEEDSLDLGHPGGGGFAVEVAVPAEGASSPVLTGMVRTVGDAVQWGGSGDGQQQRAVRLTSARCP